MIASGGSTPPTPVDPGDLSNYVQDGLVLHLDGIDKGETSGRWSSLVGSEYYTLNTHSTNETNAVVMDGSGVIQSTSTVSVDYTSGTIEICAEIITAPSSSIVIMYGLNNKLGVCFIPEEGYVFGIGANANNNKWIITPQTIFTCSMNSLRCVLNGVSGGSLGTTTFTAQNGITYNSIGGRNGFSTSRYSNIRIYSIRKYNRQLTETEILKNQRTDNARFNLGFNI